MLLIRSQFYNILMYLAILIIGIVCAPMVIFKKHGAHYGIQTFTRLNRWMLKHICGITYEIRGEIPSEPCVILSKHMNFLDIVMLGSSVPQPKFIMKASIKYIPILGFYAKAIGSAPVHRGAKGAADKMIDDLQANSHRNEDGQLIIYPQGTRVLPHTKRPYKNGAWRVYDRMNVPCYLAATNAGVLWERKSPHRYPGHVVLEFLDIRIEPGMPQGEFMKLISEKIETRSDELMAEFPRNKT